MGRLSRLWCDFRIVALVVGKGSLFLSLQLQVKSRPSSDNLPLLLTLLNELGKGLVLRSSYLVFEAFWTMGAI
jgi:hypothetical protein